MEARTTTEMPSTPTPVTPSAGPIKSAKEAVETWKVLNRTPASTAKQVVLGLSLTGYIDENFEPSLLQGYLEAMEHPSEERNGKIYFLWQ